jgi:hypothetical protein
MVPQPGDTDLADEAIGVTVVVTPGERAEPGIDRSIRLPEPKRPERYAPMVGWRKRIGIGQRVQAVGQRVGSRRGIWRRRRCINWRRVRWGWQRIGIGNGIRRWYRIPRKQRIRCAQRVARRKRVFIDISAEVGSLPGATADDQAKQQHKPYRLPQSSKTVYQGGEARAHQPRIGASSLCSARGQAECAMEWTLISAISLSEARATVNAGRVSWVCQ